MMLVGWYFWGVLGWKNTKKIKKVAVCCVTAGFSLVVVFETRVLLCYFVMLAEDSVSCVRGWRPAPPCGHKWPTLVLPVNIERQALCLTFDWFISDWRATSLSDCRKHFYTQTNLNSDTQTTSNLWVHHLESTISMFSNSRFGFFTSRRRSDVMVEVLQEVMGSPGRGTLCRLMDSEHHHTWQGETETKVLTLSRTVSHFCAASSSSFLSWVLLFFTSFSPSWILFTASWSPASRARLRASR